MAERLSAGPGHNGVDEFKLKSWVEQWEALEDVKIEIKAECGGRVAAKSKEQGNLLVEMKKEGYGKEVFKALIKDRDLDRKKKENRSSLETNEKQVTFDQMIKLLGEFGDTELGRAALATAPNGAEDADLRARFMQPDEEKAALLKEGIAPIGAGKKGCGGKGAADPMAH